MQIDLTKLELHINECYKPFFRAKHRFAILYGGSGSGKSFAIAQKLVWRLMTEDNHNVLCVRKTGNSLVKSVFALLRGVLVSWGIDSHFEINKSQGREQITFKPNGNRIIFSGLDDVEKLKSIFNITSIWIEEASEIDKDDFTELNRRLRGYEGKNKNVKRPKYMQIVLSFNPVSYLSWIKSYFFDSNKSDTFILKTTYKDNKFIDSVYAEQMEQQKHDSPYEYMVYTLGEWGIVGDSYFAKEQVANRIHDLGVRNWLKRGEFVYEKVDGKIKDDSIRFVDGDDGYITVYAEPLNGYPYVIGGDTAGDGNSKSTENDTDKFAGHVLNNITGEQVAVLHARLDEDLYAEQMYCLGKMYNTALIGIEANYSTHPIKHLTALGYDNQYNRERTDTYDEDVMRKYGFKTDKITRPLILSNLKSVVRDSVCLINDKSTLEEMVTFVRNDKGRPEAMSGKHDDLVMALAIAWHIREQGGSKVATARTAPVKKLFDKKRGKLNV